MKYQFKYVIAMGINGVAVMDSKKAAVDYRNEMIADGVQMIGNVEHAK